MATNEDRSNLPADFDRWLAALIEDRGPVTCLVALAQRCGDALTPLSSTYLHIDDAGIAWDDLAIMLAGSGHPWDVIAISVTTARNGGALDNPAAHRALQDFVARACADPHSLWQCDLFDATGSSLARPSV